MSDDTLEELKAWYIGSLQERIEALEGPISACREGGGSEEAEKTIRQIAHSLRGSGATYGFPQITEAAAAVEDAPEADLVGLADTLIDVLKSTAGEG
ncbi:MAG: Hpt domain-containing protein [Verrucomicrobiota bacterium]